MFICARNGGRGKPFLETMVKGMYLALQERRKWNRPSRNAHIGDLVLLVEQCMPGPICRIIIVLPGKDGLLQIFQPYPADSETVLA